MAKLLNLSLISAEVKRNLHRASPEKGTKLKDLLAPEYWAGVGKRLTVGDKIEVLPEGGIWYAELLVTHCSNVHAKVEVLVHKELQAEATEDDENAPFITKWSGPQRRWSVIRRKDKAVVKEGFDGKDQASAWIAENASDLA